ncbi:MAG TPA: carbon-nitrogen hydrolase family protein [Candidatus Competibacteraceae bacterium]|nr:carbon-nitrogen hydrolase family protein [Candidatus Competibacteraceae bacterium]HQA26695.1 carbon-nitrogen hydrolase family protein [Candidatus Competibacteraceae bacterium]HQD56187.1 carbon-nitrogen hydrolase family protein [Candidatus Competibacteraceae bacterium]
MSIMAAIQMVSGPSVADNLAVAAELLAQAADQGAQLAVLPENFALMDRQEEGKLAVSEAEGDGPIQAFLAEQADRHRLWLVGGTIPLRVAGDERRVYAACLLYDDHGRPVARYDKVHLFDVQVVGSAERYAESATIAPGHRYVVADTPLGRLGLAVCYDLRFPEQFRTMVGHGMEILALPAAFTATTGAAHWDVLLRARAIENQCYVIAAAQGGRHANGRETYGDSLIADPWGGVLQRLPQGPGVVLAEWNREHLENVRRQFPALTHRVDCEIGE